MRAVFTQLLGLIWAIGGTASVLVYGRAGLLVMMRWIVVSFLVGAIIWFIVDIVEGVIWRIKK